MVCLSVLAILDAVASWPYDKIDRVDEDPMETLVSNWCPAPFERKAKVLLFSECFGYNHHGGRCYGDYLVRRAGEVYGAWDVVQETNSVRLGDAPYLADFDAVLFNNCRKPLEWQTYDIVFRAPRFDENGNVTEKPRLTLLFNGLPVHNNLILESLTGAPLSEEMVAVGPLLLQDHNNKVSFRNIWMCRLPERGLDRY